MIDNKIIRDYLNCKYKAYNNLTGIIGIKKDYELMRNEISENLFVKFIELLNEKFSESKVIQFLEPFNSEIFFNGKNKKLVLGFKSISDVYNLYFHGIELNYGKLAVKNGRVIPYLFSEKEKVSKQDKLDLTIRSLIFTKCTGIEIQNCRIYYGRSMNTLKFRIHKFIPECLRIITDIENVFLSKKEPVLCKNDHCKICEYEEICHKRLIERDDLSLLSSIHEKDLVRYEKKGIFTVKQLSYTYRPRKRNQKISTKRHPYYASLQALAIRDKKVYVFDKINLPNCEIVVFIDCEGDTENNFIYLIGILICKGESEQKYSFWANSKDEETTIIEKVMNILINLGDATIFYYGKYDWKVLKKVLFKTDNSNVKRIITEKSIDILAKIRRNIYFPTYSNSLKEIATYLGFFWSDSKASGLQSVVWRYNWEKTNDNHIKDTLIRYNQEDCVALKILVDFLQRLLLSENDATISFVNNLISQDVRQFKIMNCVTKEIEVITKGAYFEYQRNKIYFRNNPLIKKRIKRVNSKIRKYKINKKILVLSKLCPSCKSKNILYLYNKLTTRTSIDLHIGHYCIKRWVVKYYSPRHKCIDCKTRFLPLKLLNIKLFCTKNAIPNKFTKFRDKSGYGHNLLAWIIHQLIVNHVSLNNLHNNLKEYFGIDMSKINIRYLKIVASNFYRETYNQIISNLRDGAILHADETKVTLRNNSGYVWVFTNMEEVIYLYKPNRETCFLQEFMGDFKGVLISDFYPGYDSLNCKKQKCLIHLVRDLNDMLLENPFDTELRELVSSFGILIKEIITTIDRYGLKKYFLSRHIKKVKKYYEQLKNRETHSENYDKIRKRLIDYKDELFTFLENDNVPWNNNNAEYAIKHFADYRSSVKGLMTDNSLESYLILLSIYQTCNYKGITFFDFLLSKRRNIDLFGHN